MFLDLENKPEMKEELPERTRAWFLTVPADGEHGVTREDMLAALEPYERFCGQLELSDTGYLHWQLVVAHKHAIAFKTLKNKLPSAHLEVPIDLGAAARYCQKRRTRVLGEEPLLKGDFPDPSPGARHDLDELREKILTTDLTVDELLLSDPCASRHIRMVNDLVAARDRQRHGTARRDVKVRVIFGDTGTGKTTTALEELGQIGSVCRVTNWKGPGTFDGYDGQRGLVLDEFRGQPPVSELLTWIDVHPVELPARFRNRQAMFTNVYILSNAAPWEWYPKQPVAVRKALARRIDTVEQRHSDGNITHYSPEEVLEKMAPESAKPAAQLPLSQMFTA